MAGMGGISFWPATVCALRLTLHTTAKSQMLNRKGAILDMLALVFMVEPCKNTTL